MAKRTVNVGIMTYVNAKGVAGTIGYRGEEVDVHADDLERFDALNENPGGNEPWAQERAAVSMVSPAAGEETSGVNSGLNTSVSRAEADESTAEDDAKEADLEPSKDDVKAAEEAEKARAEAEAESAPRRGRPRGSRSK